MSDEEELDEKRTVEKLGTLIHLRVPHGLKGRVVWASRQRGLRACL